MQLHFGITGITLNGTFFSYPWILNLPDVCVNFWHWKFNLVTHLMLSIRIVYWCNNYGNVMYHVTVL